jgi:hypothetical protein
VWADEEREGVREDVVRVRRRARRGRER